MKRDDGVAVDCMQIICTLLQQMTVLAPRHSVFTGHMMPNCAKNY